MDFQNTLKGALIGAGGDNPDEGEPTMRLS
jgi:hypothetical protein